MRSILGQSLAKTNREFFFLYKDVSIFSPTIRAERAKATKKERKRTKESDNGSLSHIVLCYEYFILERKHIENERGRERKISIIIASILSCLSFYQQSSGEVPATEVSQCLFKQNEMNTHIYIQTHAYRNAKCITLRSCRLSCARFIYTHYDYTKKEFICKREKKIKEDKYDRKRFVF